MKHVLLLLAALAIAPLCSAQAPHIPVLEQNTLEAPKLLETLAQQPSPEPFIQELYREIQQLPTPEAFSGGAGASRIYRNPLLSSVHKEFRGSVQSFAGQLDYTPLCVCHDPTGFTLSPIVLTTVDKSHTDAVFTLHFDPRPKPAPPQQAQSTGIAFPEDADPTPSQTSAPAPPDRRITLRLVHGEHGWRVDDIASADIPSMKFFLHQRHPEASDEADSKPVPQTP